MAEDSAAKILDRSSLYRQFLAEREEILKLKWIESEKAGKDIEIVPNARVVPGGIVRLMELSDQGFFMIRP